MVRKISEGTSRRKGLREQTADLRRFTRNKVEDALFKVVGGLTYHTFTSISDPEKVFSEIVTDPEYTTLADDLFELIYKKLSSYSDKR